MNADKAEQISALIRLVRNLRTTWDDDEEAADAVRLIRAGMAAIEAQVPDDPSLPR